MVYLYGTLFPYYWTDYVNRGAGAKHTLLISNIPSYIKPVTYADGCKAKRGYFIGTGAGNLATSIGILTVCKRAQLTINSDDTQMEVEDIQDFIGHVSDIIKD